VQEAEARIAGVKTVRSDDGAVADDGSDGWFDVDAGVADADPTDTSTASTGIAGAGKATVRRVLVRGAARRVRIVGDSSVATARVRGPHVLKRDSDSLEITSEDEVGPLLEGFSVANLQRTIDRFRAQRRDLTVRMNPSLELAVDVTGTVLSSRDVPSLGKIRLTCSAAEFKGVARADDIVLLAGSVSLAGRLVSGRSRVRVESGQANILLEDGSDVAIHAEAQLGKINWTPGRSHPPISDDHVLGDGAARLDIGVVMGQANITT
jgi:hypothetical protein